MTVPRLGVGEIRLLTGSLSFGMMNKAAIRRRDVGPDGVERLREVEPPCCRLLGAQ